MTTPSRITFGLVVPSAGSVASERVNRFVEALGERMGMTVERRDAASYEALANDVREGLSDLAWLPPIVFVRLGDAVSPIGSILRGGNSTYEAALVVPAASKVRAIDSLRGLRAGWVDRWSAAGFVLPRVNLSLLGVDPRTLFRSETFHGSHRSAINALTQGLCDVTGTYARADDDGHVTTGAWSEIAGADVRVLATFGAIPPDVVGVRKGIAADVSASALGALKDMCNAEMGLLHDIFGGYDLREGLAPGYESLKAALDMATARGIFDMP
jgi:ABC-type phosphate/phosphonate transport system substrate-binding protein